MVDSQLVSLRRALEAGTTSVHEVVDGVLERIASLDDDAVWISRVPEQDLRARADELQAVGPGNLPLFGIPYAIKDNIDAAGMETTAACPGFAYRSKHNAAAVERLHAAGAMLIGKTNLDQFATGLVGVRSPYGVPHNPVVPGFVPGGSSSGSAVAVATGCVSFALGTDTAGSGRVPAAFCNIAGIKPSRGLISARGVVPACRSLDCVSIFGLTVTDAALVLGIAAGFDPDDPYSRAAPPVTPVLPRAGIRIGVPSGEQLEFFGNDEYAAAFERAIAALSDSLAGEIVGVDFRPFRETADLLYSGPWVAERRAALGRFFDDHPDELLEVTRHIIGGADQYDAVDAFTATYRLRELRGQSEATWQEIDLLALPTAGTIVRVEDLELDPVGPNTDLGYYTNFVNLLDLSAVAVPGGFTASGLPFGITLMAPAFHDWALIDAAQRYEARLEGPLGATNRSRSTGTPMSATSPTGPDETGVPALRTDHAADPSPAGPDGAGGGANPTNNATDPPPGWMDLAVFGLHLHDQPLAHQLTERGAVFLGEGRTAPRYRMYVLPEGREKPGVIEVADDGVSIPLEIWRIPEIAIGSFLAGIPRPLGLGTVILDNERPIFGFICEGHVATSARDITALGGWRGYLASSG